MTITAAEKVAGHSGEKKDDKVEKRRALGRGLGALLPGPRVVSPESRVASPEPVPPQGLKPESPLAVNGTLRPGSGQASEAVPFPRSVPAGSTDGAGETKVPRFAREDKIDGDDKESEAHEPGQGQYSTLLNSPPFAKNAKDGAPSVNVAPRFEEQGDEVISIQAVADAAVPHHRVMNVPVDAIEKNPYQTRYVFDEEMLGELRDSIREHGVVQPIVVRPAEEEEGRYILVLGERRLRASKMAEKETIPALVRRLSPQQAAEMTVLENVMREDLNPIEQAEAFRVLSLEFKLTQEQIADRIGMSRETVSNYMRLLRLPRKVMDYMLSDRLSFSDAREILRLENDEYIEEVAEEVVAHKLKWDQIEDRVMRINGSFPLLPGQTLPGAPKKKGGARWMDPNVRAAQTDMERTLGMRVRIRDRHGKGKIVIEYASVDDYDRVTSLLRGKK
jgi:ParB family transcriptional regulator, chromosome partitioning protein